MCVCMSVYTCIKELVGACRGVGSLELELQIVVIPCDSSKSSKPLTLLHGPTLAMLKCVLVYTYCTHCHGHHLCQFVSPQRPHPAIASCPGLHPSVHFLFLSYVLH